MLPILKKFFSFQRLSRKAVFFGVVLLGIFCFFVPSYSAQASVLSFMGKSISFLPMEILILTLQFMLLLVNVIVLISTWFLQWTLHNPFGVSFTNPATNPVINVG